MSPTMARLTGQRIEELEVAIADSLKILSTLISKGHKNVECEETSKAIKKAYETLRKTNPAM